jgi:hypothetical protein
MGPGGGSERGRMGRRGGSEMWPMAARDRENGLGRARADQAGDSERAAGVRKERERASPGLRLSGRLSNRRIDPNRSESIRVNPSHLAGSASSHRLSLI